jgi:hypothetical protein
MSSWIMLYPLLNLFNREIKSIVST